MLYTSYFAKMKKLPKELKVISIARWTPKGVVLDSYPDLFPSQALLSDYKQGLINKEDYIIRYNKQLEKLNPEKVFKDLDQCVLVCYEKSSDFCHRHLVSSWLQNFGFEAQEFS